MEKHKEVRRGSMSTRRRHRITSLRDSIDGDREVLNVNKRMKIERLGVQKRFNREDEEGADEILNNNNNDDGENNRRNSPASSSISSHSNRRPVGSPSMLRMIDEMVVGVPVPRKARSVSVRRSHENLSSGKEQSHRKFLASPDVASSSSQSCSLRNKKMKSLKTRFRTSSTITESSSSILDDIEIEVAEALFDLTKQSRSHSQSKSESSTKRERSSNVNKTADDISTCFSVNIDGANGKDVENGKDAFSVKNNLIIEIKADNEEASKMGITRSLVKPDEMNIAERIALRKEESVGEVRDSYESSVCGDMNEESGTSKKLSADNPLYLASSKANWAAKAIEKRREGKFEIDLMGPPHMPLSQERDGLFDHPQREVQDVHMKSEKGMFNEDKLVADAREGKKVESLYIKKDPSQCQAPTPEAFSLPVSFSGTSWPTGYPHPGRYMATFPIVNPVDRSAKSLTALQPPPFSLSKPRPKRCVTHQYIASSIKFHQHLTKNSMSPAAASSATLIGGKLHNHNSSPSLQDVIIGHKSRGDFPDRQTLAMVSDPSGKDKSPGASNNVDSTNGKQLMLQQGLQQIASTNMLHGQAMVFQLGQQQASLAPPTNWPGYSKYAPAIGSFGMPSNSSYGPPVSSFASSAGTTLVNFSDSNMPPNAASPYMAIYQNNGYPLSFSANVGGPPSNKGGAQAAVMPFLNGSYYSSPMFHMSQCQPQQSHSQSQVQTSSVIQPHGQPQMGAQISHDTYLPQMPKLLQQSEKRRASQSRSADKPAAETSHINNAQVSESPASHSQKSNSNRTFMVPTSSNQNEQQQQKQQGSKGGYQLMPPQAFGLSFSSAASTTPTLGFSSITQNPTVFQMLPDMGRQVYQFGPGNTEMTQHKNFKMSEGRTVSSISNIQEKKGLFGNSHVNAGQSRNGSRSSCCSEPSTSTPTTAVIDSSGRTVNFVQSPVSNGSQTFHYSPTLPVSVTSAYTTNSQQQHHNQLAHLQKQYQEMQQTGTSQFKEPNSNALSCSFTTSNLPNNNPVSSQTVTQTSSSTQSSKLKFLPSSRGSSVLNATSLKDISQQQMIHPLSQTRVAFGSDSNISAAFQAQQLVVNNLSAASLVGGSLSNCSISKGTAGNSNTASAGSKSLSTSEALPCQQIDTSQSTHTQKSSPVCERNVVPSIVST